MSILCQNAITKSVFFNMGLTPTPFLNNVKKTADREKRYIPHWKPPDRLLLPRNCNVWHFLAALKENLIATEKLSSRPKPSSTKHPQNPPTIVMFSAIFLTWQCSIKSTQIVLAWETFKLILHISDMSPSLRPQDLLKYYIWQKYQIFWTKKEKASSDLKHSNS